MEEKKQAISLEVFSIVTLDLSLSAWRTKPMTDDYRFLKACRREPVDTTPVWIMRQAGRYLPEYRKVRERADFLTMCKTPELAAEVTIQPVDRLGVDAAILFSDILILVEAMGLPLDFHEQRGPVLHYTVTDQASVDKLRIPDPAETVSFLLETIKILRRELAGRVPLIGFAGAPFTVASYMIEGKTSKQFVEIKSVMFREPQIMRRLLDKVTQATTEYINAQIEAGAQAIQLFDSWAGQLAPRDFKDFAMDYARQVISGLNRDDVPIIYFAQGNPAVLDLAKQAGSDVVGVDWRIEIGKAWEILAPDVAVQGNLDPTCLFLPPEGIRERVKEIIDQVGGRPGHIFNLGHGILPPTPVENAIALVEAVHELGAHKT